MYPVGKYLLKGNNDTNIIGRCSDVFYVGNEQAVLNEYLKSPIRCSGFNQAPALEEKFHIVSQVWRSFWRSEEASNYNWALIWKKGNKGFLLSVLKRILKSNFVIFVKNLLASCFLLFLFFHFYNKRPGSIKTPIWKSQQPMSKGTTL